MPISPDTKNEIQVILQKGVHLPRNYAAFLMKWLAYNSAYNEIETDICGDRNKAVALAERFEHRWNEVEHMARQLVALECIGGKRVPNSYLLKTIDWVKSATHHLREQLSLDANIDPANCQFEGCERAEKRTLCNQTSIQPWDKNNMAALMRLVYQVRCNLVHGDKQLVAQNIQTNRDQELVHLADQIMDHFLRWIVNDNP